MVRERDFVDECCRDKDLYLLKKLTLIVPTFNRGHYLSRCLWYHAHFPYGQIIVADSSPEQKKVVNRATAAKIAEMFGANILYLEYPLETEKYGGDIYRKWADAVRHVATEYAQICTDKEFVIPTTASRCIRYLSDHPGYIAGYGFEYRFEYDADEGFRFVNRHAGRKAETADNSLQRLDDALRRVPQFANSILLAVTRTEILKEIYVLYCTLNPHDLRYGELFLGYSGYIAGKVHHDPGSISRVRDEVQRQKELALNGGLFFNHSPESSSSRYPTYQEYLQDGIADAYYRPIRYGFETLLLKYSSLSEEEIDEYLEENEELKTIFNTATSRPRKLWMLYLDYLQSVCRNILPLSVRNHMNRALEKITLKTTPSHLPPVLDEQALGEEIRTVADVIAHYPAYLDKDTPVL